MTYRQVIQKVCAKEYMPRAMLERVRQRGPIIVVQPVGSFATMPGALFMTALVALPGETQQACLDRFGIKAQPNDCVFTFEFNSELERNK